jgi:MFS family permease
VSSPIFAEASKHVNAFRLIALGLGVWTVATAGCGLSIGACQHVRAGAQSTQSKSELGIGKGKKARFSVCVHTGFWSLIICRMFVGVGEASFVALAGPFIGE